MKGWLWLCALILVSNACGEQIDPDAPWSIEELRLIGSMSPLKSPPPSPGNRYADDPKAAALGHSLFFDKRLSSNGQTACASCHVPELYFSDGLERSNAKGTTERHAPSLVGSQWSPFQFWDGRKDSLWAQAHGPLESDVEHDLTRTEVAHFVAAHYRTDYEALFGALPALDDKQRFARKARPHRFNDDHSEHKAWMAMAPSDRRAINEVFANVGKAIEAYERKLTPQPAAFDAYVAALKSGDPKGGGNISAKARRGLRHFIGQAQCINCHNGPVMSDGGFHNLGLPRTRGLNGIDMGRTDGADRVRKDPFSCGGPFSDQKQCDELRFLDPQFEDFLGAFKTPTLRNVAKTAPYMHGGHFATLLGVVNFYKTIPGKPQIGHRDLILKQIDPEVSSAELVAFLETLTGALPAKRWLRPPGTQP